MMMMPPRNKCKERSSPEPQKQPPSPKHDPYMPSSSSSSPAVDNFTYPFYPPGPGVRFVPNDEEIIFILNYWRSFPEHFINSRPNLPVHRVNIYHSNPQQLSEEYKKGNLKEWFFLSERTKSSNGGKRQKRSDNGGYWHATVAAKKIEAGDDVVGYKTSLVYYVRKPSNAVKTDWLMHEYWLEPSQDNQTRTEVDYSLCKIYLSPTAINKKKQESVQDSEEKVEPHQPQAEEQHQLPLSSSSPFHLPGYQFVPNDEDIIFILFNWKTFPQGYIKPWLYFPVYHVNIYESNPHQLSVKYKKGNREEWFFMFKRTKTCKGGKRQRRGDNGGGYWHATTATKKIKAGEEIVGYKTALAYNIGKPSDGRKRNWLMHEYWLDPKPSQESDNETVECCFLCKIYLSPMAKRKKQEEGVDASEEKVEQPSNVAFQLPQVQQKQPTNVAFQLPLVQQKQPTNAAFQQPQEQEQQLSNVEFQQPQEREKQPINVAFQQPQVQEKQPSNVADQKPHQPEFCLPPVDSLQPQAEEEEKWPMPFISDELYQMLNDHNIPDDVDGLFPPYDDLFTPEDRARFLDEIAREALLKKPNTLLN
ncbi:unnamed protein product [Microthlaspi erraticum]|uniref:NAC domain-containing protein n=1 Tax=Microthlaspi erraticum TaxID=1685480 RepID=A0A6D2L1R8_9BRAS|nr:unnamed protein product [Microthlaspi erraticum]